jgi:azurin
MNHEFKSFASKKPEKCFNQPNNLNESIIYLVQRNLKSLAETNQIIDSKSCKDLALSLKHQMNREKLIELLELP